MNFGHVSFVKKSYIKATNAKNSILMSEDEKQLLQEPHVRNPGADHDFRYGR